MHALQSSAVSRRGDAVKNVMWVHFLTCIFDKIYDNVDVLKHHCNHKVMRLFCFLFVFVFYESKHGKSKTNFVSNCCEQYETSCSCGIEFKKAQKTLQNIEMSEYTA